MTKKNLLEVDADTDNLIRAVVERLARVPAVTLNHLAVTMDLMICHNAGHVDLEVLLHATDDDLLHDLQGIGPHLDRESGELRRFLPRCSPGTAVRRPPCKSAGERATINPMYPVSVRFGSPDENGNVRVCKMITHQAADAEDAAIAARVAHTWNLHDRLVVAIEAMLEYCPACEGVELAREVLAEETKG